MHSNSGKRSSSRSSKVVQLLRLRHQRQASHLEHGVRRLMIEMGPATAFQATALPL
jgi:hypothetical protein